MKSSMKAPLLSAFVFPGSGHLLLKKHISASIIFSAAAISIYLLIDNLMTRAITIGEKVVSGEIPYDAYSIAAAIELQSANSDPLLINITSSVFIFSWLFSIIDSYRLGDIADKKQADTPNTTTNES